MGLAETAKLIASLALEDHMSKGIASATGSINKLDTSIGRVGKGAGQLSAGFVRAGTIIAGAAVTGLGAAAKAGADFEAQLNTINTVAQTSETDLKGIGDGIRALARETGTGLGDLTSAYYDLVSAGIKTADAQNVLTQANKLAIGGLSTTGEAVDLLTTAINSYGGDATKAAQYANDFAEAIGAGKTTAAEIAASFANVGPLAAKFGVGIDEISAALGVMTAKGTPAAEVFTQMRAAIKLLAKPTKDLQALQSKTGRDYAKIAKKNGIVAAYQQMEKDAKKAGTSVLALSGRMEAALFSAAVTGDSFADYNAELDKVRHSSDGAGVAAEQMAQRQKGLTFQVTRLKAGLVDAGLTLSEGFLPALTRSADKLVKFLSLDSNRSVLKGIGEDIGKAIDGIDWQDVIDGAKTFVSVLKVSLDYAKRIFDVLNALPTEVKAAGLGLIGLNKLSGGLIGSGLGNIVGGLAGAVTKSLAASLPGVGKAFVQPVFVTNLPPGGGLGGVPGAAGAAAGGLSGLQKVFLVGEAIGLAAAVNEVRQGISDESTAHATAIHEQTSTWLAQQPNKADLVNGLAAVDTGIRDLQSNPLNVLVQGDALNQLKGMRADIVHQLGDVNEHHQGTAPGDTASRDKAQGDAESASQARNAAFGSDFGKVVAKSTDIEALRGSVGDRLAAAEAAINTSGFKEVAAIGSSGAQQVSATNIGSVRTSSATLLSGAIQSAATYGAAGQITSAIRSIPAPIVNVNVSATTIQKTTTITKRYGDPTTSRDGDGGNGPGQ